jgi:hypothetical protein
MPAINSLCRVNWSFSAVVGKASTARGNAIYGDSSECWARISCAFLAEPANALGLSLL